MRIAKILLLLAIGHMTLVNGLGFEKGLDRLANPPDPIEGRTKRPAVVIDKTCSLTNWDSEKFCGKMWDKFSKDASGNVLGVCCTQDSLIPLRGWLDTTFKAGGSGPKLIKKKLEEAKEGKGPAAEHGAKIEEKAAARPKPSGKTDAEEAKFKARARAKKAKMAKASGDKGKKEAVKALKEMKKCLFAKTRFRTRNLCRMCMRNAADDVVEDAANQITLLKVATNVCRQLMGSCGKIVGLMGMNTQVEASARKILKENKGRNVKEIPELKEEAINFLGEMLDAEDVEELAKNADKSKEFCKLITVGDDNRAIEGDGGSTDFAGATTRRLLKAMYEEDLPEVRRLLAVQEESRKRVLQSPQTNNIVLDQSSTGKDLFSEDYDSGADLQEDEFESSATILSILSSVSLLIINWF